MLTEIHRNHNGGPLRSLAEPLRVVMDDRAKHVLIPIENKRTSFKVSRGCRR
jgi:hypothetical protein